MKTNKEIKGLLDKLEKFRKNNTRKFGGTDYAKLRGWIDALSWVLSDKDYMELIKKKFDSKVVSLIEEFSQKN